MTPQARQIEDALLSNDTALPSAASTTVNTAVIDLDAFRVAGAGGGSPGGSGLRQSNVEIGVSIPALTTTMLPDTKTLSLALQLSDDPAFGSGVETIRSLLLTGAGGVGVAVPSLLQDRLPGNGARYARTQIISGANTTDMSALKAHFAAKF